MYVRMNSTHVAVIKEQGQRKNNVKGGVQKQQPTYRKLKTLIHIQKNTKQLSCVKKCMCVHLCCCTRVYY